MRYEFVKSSLQRLLDQGTLKKHESMLAICAGTQERDVFAELGFENATISNLDDRMQNPDFSPFQWSYQDAQTLTFPDDSFDYVFVSDGLHHCDSPHRALIEMIRVARKAVVVFESRDSLVMRVAARLGLAAEYEVEAVIGNQFAYGGVNNSEIPNYVYRWTEREFEKTVNSYIPDRKHSFAYFYALNLPHSRLAMGASLVKRIATYALSPIAKLVGLLAPSQCNSFCMIGLKGTRSEHLWPWLESQSSEVRFKRAYAASRYTSK